MMQTGTRIAQQMKVTFFLPSAYSKTPCLPLPQMLMIVATRKQLKGVDPLMKAQREQRQAFLRYLVPVMVVRTVLSCEACSRGRRPVFL